MAPRIVTGSHFVYKLFRTLFDLVPQGVDLFLEFVEGLNVQPFKIIRIYQGTLCLINESDRDSF